MYRFRSIYSLLYGYHELENQEIYFASPEELNDPMEGFRDIFWKGDSIVWENLLKNYVYCVDHVYALTIIANDQIKLSIKDIPLDNYPNPNITPQRIDLLRKIRLEFFSHPFIKTLPGSLAKRNNPVRRGELLTYLLFIHQHALNAVNEVYLREGLIVKSLFKFDSNALNGIFGENVNLVDIINQMESENIENLNKIEIFFLLTHTIKQAAFLSNFVAHDKKWLLSNSMFLLNDFSEMFVSKLETLLYPNWYSASFLSDCTNSAVWGHYGDNHKGVCLIFKSKENDKQLRFSGMQPLTFRKINYHNKHVEIDFFRSLGRSPTTYLESLWYKDTEGNVSICADHLYQNTASWRKLHWENFYSSISIKLKEWKYEKEYRLIIEGLVSDYSDKNKRKLKYNFEDLEGIIFGIKTSQVDKIKILQIIKDKCTSSGRKTFDFYQAYYSKNSGSIEKQKINLLSVD